uniref:Ig-like domain-containing protein n=1 Tax=Strix occidentalis caurina TaxID=311401 RepID=A0A8D0EM24_STROC
KGGECLQTFIFLLYWAVMLREKVTVAVGSSSVLTCSPKSNITMVTWKINPKVGGSCTLGYRADQNKTDRTNCSDSIDWKLRPDWDPALEIRQVEIAHEGDYTCEVVATDGNFHKTHHLAVLAPPRLTLYCDGHGVPMCEAAAGKPPAQISWALESTSAPKEEAHDNGTVTVLSKFTALSTNRTNTTCIVSHPAGNQSKSIACRPSGKLPSVCSAFKTPFSPLFMYVWDMIHTHPFGQSWGSFEGFLVLIHVRRGHLGMSQTHQSSTCSWRFVRGL